MICSIQNKLYIKSLLNENFHQVLFVWYGYSYLEITLRKTCNTCSNGKKPTLTKLFFFVCKARLSQLCLNLFLAILWSIL